MKTFFLTLILSLTFTACHKEGTGGKAMLHGAVLYNGVAIPNATVSIWYGKTSVADPANGYDDQEKTDAKGKFEFHDLWKGDYYLYAQGTDTTVGATRVGGIAAIIKSKSEIVYVNIAVK